MISWLLNAAAWAVIGAVALFFAATLWASREARFLIGIIFAMIMGGLVFVWALARVGF